MNGKAERSARELPASEGKPAGARGEEGTLPWWRFLGPGLLVACAAIGGSHLVWATRAGAVFGWDLLGLLLVANLVKMPFFLFGQTYTAATGESLLAGYRRRSVVYVWIFLGINLLTSVINVAGVTMLAAALVPGGVDNWWSLPGRTAVLLAVVTLFVGFGRYRWLDRVAKGVIAFLTVLTLVAVLLALRQGPAAPPDFVGPAVWTVSGFGFLVLFLGWMPAPIDLSAWSSLWMFSRGRETGQLAGTRAARWDFYLGYGATLFMAVCFLALGALVMFGSGAEFTESGIGFAQQLVGLYAASIGPAAADWVLVAAFITMLSTSLTCLDGYPRALAACTVLLRPQAEDRFRRIHQGWMAVVGLGAVVVVLGFVHNLIVMLSFAAYVSFLTSPLLAWINFRVMHNDVVPEEERPHGWIRLLSYAGLLFLGGMAIGFLWIQG